LTKHRDIFRVACLEDIDAILGFTANGVQGLTNVPRTRERVEEQLQETIDTLNGKEGANRIIFVVERDGQVLGISGIIVRVGIEAPFYNFKRNHHSGRSANPVLAVDYDTLQMTTDFNGYTEVASLFMGPAGRGTGLARLLSMGRFGYIRNNRDQFADGLMAEILGWTDENGNSPFWKHLASRFIDMPFDNADKLSTIDKRFIVDLLPGIPIMLNLLPDIVTECTGRPHASSARAMNMLQSIGFEKTDMCDVFDGGPAVKCPTDRTWIARSTRLVETLDAPEDAEICMHFSGEGAEFRAALGPALIQDKRADTHAASLVKKDKGAPVYIAQIREPAPI
jgi:arginine N-succinyltransferase